MSYDSKRNDEQLNVLDKSIDAFIAAYKDRNVSPNKRRTVFVFPGGLASRLLRATVPYDDATDTPQTFDYDICWATPQILINGSAVLLGMQKTASGVYLDSNKQIVVADGAIGLHDLLALPEEMDTQASGLTPYSGFKFWCDQNDVDCFIYGWDWRRRVQDVGGFFIGPFLTRFNQRMKDECGLNTPDRFAVVGHSAGGMVVNWIMRNLQNAPQLQRVVTVGAPFYGYAGQLHRWFEGDSLVNGLNGEFTDAIVRTVCKLPGCYAWNFACQAVYEANKQAFHDDGEAPLLAYPSMDATTANLVADPYVPQTNAVNGAVLTRYLTNVGFDMTELADAKSIVDGLVAPLTQAQIDKFYNVRGMNAPFGGIGAFFGDLAELVGAENAANFVVQSDTIGSTRWEWVPGNTPTIIDGPLVPGDGVQPAWTARHLDLMGLPVDHVVNAKGPDAKHAVLMSAPSVITKLANVLNF